jgi:hypothetical protein
MAFRATALADVLLAAVAALVNRVSDQNLAALKVSAEAGDVHAGARTMTKAKSALFADVRNAKLALTCVLRRDGSDSGLYRQFVNGARRTRPLVRGSEGV